MSPDQMLQHFALFFGVSLAVVLAGDRQVEVRDRRTLIPANHVRRRVRRGVPAE
jgi:hypothetical protein